MGTCTVEVEQMHAYSEAVRSGLYAKKSGLVGKYDNVRRYWEDEITRQFIRPHVQQLIDRCRERMERLRILDLGCGSADGFELLTGLRRRDSDLRVDYVDLITSNVLGLYKGLDLNADLLAQARAIYGANSKMVFAQGDFCEGLPIAADERPYDLYFTSFGTCSHHLDDETMVNLLVEIAQRTRENCLVVCDWIGRYSYEWQTLWTNEHEAVRKMDYVVSYIYDEKEREARRHELQHLTLRLMSRPEAEAIIAEASRRAGVEIKPLRFFDRSVFVGRHMDTREYNPHAQAIRRAVNSLHEDNSRTNLESLIIDYSPRQGFEHLNNYFEHLQLCWNALLNHTCVLLDSYNERAGRYEGAEPPVPASAPPVLRQMMDRMRRVVEGVGWLETGLPRENIIEPQLGYALRHLVASLQQGLGAAHGLVAVLEIDKTQGSPGGAA